MTRFDAIVIGAGPAGLIAALALTRAGVPTAFVGAPAADNRTTALLAGSVEALETLDVWSGCRDRAASLRFMRLVDDTGRLVRAPEVKFDAAEIGLAAFGANIENKHLVGALVAALDACPLVERFETEAQSVETDEALVNVVLASGDKIAASLVVAADGKKSLARAAAAIDVEQRTYPQTALSLTLSHTRPHCDTSTEFHTASGPFTLVPLRGQRSSLVWVLDPDDAERMLALDDATLSREIERRSHSILGKISVEAPRGKFPLTVASAKTYAQNRIALVGEAAHVLPPIGAQGLNLGLRDAIAIGAIAGVAHAAGNDIGSGDVLRNYDEERRGDVSRRTLAVDWLNRSLLSDFIPVQTARGLGLYLLDRIAPLRRAVMREGVAPSV